jgi:hypothetical protein
MSAESYDAFVKSLPSRKTSELLALLFLNDRHYGSYTLYRLVGAGGGYEESQMWMQEARVEINDEIDRRIPARTEP